MKAVTVTSFHPSEQADVSHFVEVAEGSTLVELINGSKALSDWLFKAEYNMYYAAQPEVHTGGVSEEWLREIALDVQEYAAEYGSAEVTERFIQEINVDTFRVPIVWQVEYDNNCTVILFNEEELDTLIQGMLLTGIGLWIEVAKDLQLLQMGDQEEDVVFTLGVRNGEKEDEQVVVVNKKIRRTIR